MKKLLVVSATLRVGGVERSLLNFIQKMKSDVDLELFLCNKSGEFVKELPDDIKVIEGNKGIKYLGRIVENNPQYDTNKKTSLKMRIINILKWVYRNCGFRKIFMNASISSLKIKKKYDTVFCFYAQDELCSKVTLGAVKAKNKIAYIHADVSKFEMPKAVLKVLGKFDKILCVSKSCAQIFKNKYSKLSDKVDYLYNFQDTERILKLAELNDCQYEKSFNIVSVSRLIDIDKALMRSLEVFRKLNNQGYKFVWNVIGDGEDRLRMEEFIRNNNMQEYVKLYGHKSNPYPYIKNADIFYLGSYHEACPVVLFESLILGIPVITTNISSAKEIVKGCGFVCENSEEGIKVAFEELFKNKDLIKTKKKEIMNFSFDQEENKQRFLEMVENG